MGNTNLLLRLKGLPNIAAVSELRSACSPFSLHLNLLRDVWICKKGACR